MDVERWQYLKQILEKALEMAEPERGAYLAEACGGDQRLRAEVDEFLAFDGPVSDDLESSPISGLNSSKGVLAAGDVVGRYRIVDDLGAGGMGSVYLAERVDGDFDQQVALKIIKRGMDSEAILRRFLTERRILASLQHPNIAHLIDGGTTDDGQPYFVMEYVRGETIVDYARNRDLGLTQRLDLFREVCSAVSYAHQNLVIHRDLKPSNILINDSGIPKLLDFGIAKLLNVENSGQTATQHFVFTPEYASPEQIRGEHLTTATDIYSLGVILYELLTGSRPFRYTNKNFAEIIEAATQTVPVRPSSIMRRKVNGKEKSTSGTTTQEARLPNAFALSQLRGDLDNIVLKALRKEPERRYPTVEQFSEDIRRHFRGLPVLARKDTWLYRSETFTRRNPLLVAAVTLGFLILIGGIIATSVLARRAEAERQKAERRFNDVRVIANSLIFEVNEKIDESPIKARELLVTRAVEYLDKLAAEAGDDATLQAELSAAYEKIGDVQALQYGSGTGDTAGALQNHHKALLMREALAANAPSNIPYKLDLASSYLRIADLSATSGRTNNALEKYALAVDTIEVAHKLNDSDQNVIRELARAYAKRGQGILRSGSISEALANYEKAEELMVTAAGVDPADLKIRQRIGVYKSYAGYARLEMGRANEGLTDFMEALRIDRQLLETDPENLEYRRNVASSEQWVGYALHHLRRFDESRVHLEKAVEIQQKISDLDRSNVGDVNSLADCYLELGWTESDAGKLDTAQKHLEKAISLYETVAKTDGDNISARRQISFTRRHLGDALARAGGTGQAVRMYESALRDTEKLVKQDPNNNEFRYDKAICLSRLAEHGVNRVVGLDEAAQILNDLVIKSPENKQWRLDLEHAKNLATERRKAA